MALYRGPRRVANKIVLLVVALELISIGAWGSLTYLGSRDELLTTIGSRLSEAAQRTTNDIGDFFVPVSIQGELFLETLESNSISDERRRALAYRLLNARPEVDEFSIVEADGRESLRLSRMSAFGVDDYRMLSGDPLVERARRDRHATGEIGFSERLEPQLQMAMALVPGAEGEGGRVLLMSINLKWLWDEVQAQRVGESGYVYAVDERRAIVAHPDPSIVLSRPPLADTEIPAGFFSDTGQSRLAIYKNLFGEPVAGVSRFDSLNRWWVIVELPVKEGLAPLDRLIARFVLAFALAVIATILIVTVFSRITMRPLQRVEEGIARLARGEHDVRVEVARHTELGSLAAAFNTMADNLDRRIGDLIASEKAVRESRQALQVSEEQVRLLLDSTAEAIFGVDLAGRVTFCNPAALILFSYQRSEVQDRDLQLLLRPLSAAGALLPPGVFGQLAGLDAHRGRHLKDLLLQRADGTQLHAECWLHAMHRDGRVVGGVVTIIDITERYLHTAELQYQATHDSLTGLANRKLMQSRMDEVLQHAERGDARLALLLIDLDRFKEINDALGHKSGDLLLKQIGPRLHSVLPENGTLARLGGDEFALIIPGIATAGEATHLAQRVRDAILEPFELEEIRVQIGASIGIALCPEHAHDGSSLLRCADVAMYHAKQLNLGQAVYSKGIDAHSPGRLSLMSELLQAIRNRELVLHYQPKIDMATLEVKSFEALVRWRHPQRGLLFPEEFIPIAELGELIKPLTLWVVRQAIEDRQQWVSQGVTLGVAANISARNLQDVEFARRVNELMQQREFPPPKLQLEITESAIMTDPTRARSTVEELGALGVSFAIDDFGTGYSSLSYLRQLAVDELKIDHSFVTDMVRDENDASIVRSTVDLAHNLGMRVTAEGVETEQVWEKLRALGCDYAQGYHMCRPIPGDEVLPWVKRWRDRTGSARVHGVSTLSVLPRAAGFHR